MAWSDDRVVAEDPGAVLSGGPASRRDDPWRIRMKQTKRSAGTTYQKWHQLIQIHRWARGRLPARLPGSYLTGPRLGRSCALRPSPANYVRAIRLGWLTGSARQRHARGATGPGGWPAGW